VVAGASIPIISAVGHETDTTLIDFVSDRRAPTPTGAAEVATPVLADLAGAVADLDQRLVRACGRLVEDRRVRLRAVARGLPTRPEDLLALPGQRLDHAGSRLASALHRNVAVHERQWATAAARLNPHLLQQRVQRGQDRAEAAGRRLGAALSANVAARERALMGVAARLSPEPLHRRLDQRAARLDAVGERLGSVIPRRLDRDETRLAALVRALATLDPKRPKPGFARVEAEDGRMIAAAAALSPGQAVRLVFDDGARGARIDGGEAAPAPPRAAPVAKPRPKPAPPGQGDLF
jgi:exodeoxyribonuclease VII large subunit